MRDPNGTNHAGGTGVLGIAGVGLIGGSIAGAAKSRGLCTRVIGYGRSAARLNAAKDAGLIDDFATEIGDSCEEVDLFVSCVPVDRIPESVMHAARFMRRGGIITDGGSVKLSICNAVGVEPAPGIAFVGSHPLAGSEKGGFENADAELFQGRLCVITPRGGESETAITRVTEFWRGLGSEVVVLDPQIHDSILARTSHLPHVAAAAVASGLDSASARFAAGGFRDTTRVAAGDPSLWVSILLANRGEVSEALTEFISRCEAYRHALETNDATRLYDLLQTAKDRRGKLTFRE